MGVLAGKVVMITGGGNGIGRECALLAAREGAKVLVNDLGGGARGGDEGSPDAAESVVREIRADGGEAVANFGSVTDPHAVRQMVEQALDVFGGLHAVINPAGILRDGMFHKMDDRDWEAVLEVHLRGTYNVCRATIEHFRRQQDGSYVLFTSASGLLGNVGQANYAAAKMGVVGLSRVIALEGVPRNVRSNVIAPVAWTRLTGTIPAKDAEQAEKLARYKEKLRPDQPAKLAVALAASRDISGQIFGTQGDELTLYSQPRAIATRAVPPGGGASSILEDVIPQMREQFTPLRGLSDDLSI